MLGTLLVRAGCARRMRSSKLASSDERLVSVQDTERRLARRAASTAGRCSGARAAVAKLGAERLTGQSVALIVKRCAPAFDAVGVVL